MMTYCKQMQRWHVIRNVVTKSDVGSMVHTLWYMTLISRPASLHWMLYSSAAAKVLT